MKLTGLLAENGLHIFDYEQSVYNSQIIPRVWVMVVDKKKLKLYRKSHKGFQEIALLEFKNYHHGYKNFDDVKYFATEVSDWLSNIQNEHVFDRIVFVAQSRLLAVFRDVMPPNVQASIVAEIPKDITHLSGNELEEALQKIMII